MAKAKKREARDPDAERGRALLVQCLEAPDDDAPKLVYADWLEERGSPIAELIRKQIQGAKVRALVDQHREDWIVPLEAWIREEPFERGMVRFLQMKAGMYVQKASQAVLVAKLSQFGNRTTMLRGQTAKLAGCTSLAWTTELWWWDCQLDDDGLAALADSPHLVHLRSLVLEKVRCRNAGLEALARTPHLPRLRHFGLPAPVHLGFYDTEAVVAVLAAHPIERLNLTGVNKIEPGVLGNAPAAAKLRSLEITTSDVGALAHTTQLTALEHLRIDTFMRIGDVHFEPFLENPAFAKLSHVDLKLSHGLGNRLVERFREKFLDGFSYRATVSP